MSARGSAQARKQAFRRYERPVLAGAAVFALLWLDTGTVLAQKIEGSVYGQVGVGPDPYGSSGTAGGGGEISAGASLQVSPFEKQTFELSMLYRGYNRGYVIVDAGTTGSTEQVLRESLFNISLIADVWALKLGRFSLRPDLGLTLFLFDNELVPSTAAGPVLGFRMALELPRGLSLELGSWVMINVIQKGEEDQTSIASGVSRRVPLDGEVSWGAVTAQPALWWRPNGSRIGFGVSYGMQLFGMSQGEVRLNHGANAMLEFSFGGLSEQQDAPPAAALAAVPTTPDTSHADSATATDTVCQAELVQAKGKIDSLEQRQAKVASWERKLTSPGNCTLQGDELRCHACAVQQPQISPTAKCPPHKVCPPCPKQPIQIAGVPKAKVNELLHSVRKQIGRLGPSNYLDVQAKILSILKNASGL